MDPGVALPLPRPGFVLEPRGGKAGPLARPAELEEKGDKCGARSWRGGLWIGLQHPPWRGVGPLSERDLADKEHPEGPQKVVSHPSRRPLARLSQRGRFVLGPCNPFPGTAPQRRPESSLGPGLPPGVSAGRGVFASTAQPPHPLLESRGPPRGPCGHPREGIGRGGAERGALVIPEVAVSGHHIWTARLP